MNPKYDNGLGKRPTSTMLDDNDSMLVRILACIELELELIQTQMAQKPMLRAEVGMRVRCANKASAE